MGYKEAAYNLALLYEDELHNNTKAIQWYKIADKRGHTIAAYNLALLYKNKLDNYKEAIQWYEVAINKGNLKAFNNLGYLYHTVLKDDANSAQYYLPLIGNAYSKEKVLNFLKNKWHFSDATIQKGYELQLKSKVIPEKLKYKGGI